MSPGHPSQQVALAEEEMEVSGGRLVPVQVLAPAPVSALAQAPAQARELAPAQELVGVVVSMPVAVALQTRALARAAV